MISFSNFSLGKVKVTIQRYTSANVAGVITRTLASSTQLFTSVQPYSTIEQDQVVDPITGEWVKEILLMYSPVVVYMDDETSSNPAADLILIKGILWKPLKVEDWDHLGLSHFRVLLGKSDGY
jgi:hypothetical protein